ncbi:MAG TPA: zinc-binding dehydrogenase [Acidobacteriota bacterium]|nr:zinc-binding dehydrogenase [Acidobacteriota bacterium]
MKALFFEQHGSLEQLRFGQQPTPRPGRGEVLVRTEAASINHLDLYVIGGLPGVDLEMPHIPGSDGAGVVEEAGPEVEGLKAGDRVMLNACVWCGRCEFCLEGEQSQCVRLKILGEHRKGTFAQFFAAPESSLARIPEGVSFQTAAAYSLVFQTAWRMLASRCRLQAGQDIFIHGIGGGVATACLQIAKLAGCRVFVTSSAQEKLDRALELGADFAYNYLETDVVKAVAEETGKRGVDVVVDSVGNATWVNSLKMVRRGGKIVTCGATTGPNPATEIRLIFWKQIDILGSTMSNAREYEQVVQLLGQGRLEPVIDRVFPLSEGRQALQYVSDRKQFGKVVLRPEDSP